MKVTLLNQEEYNQMSQRKPDELSNNEKMNMFYYLYKVYSALVMLDEQNKELLNSPEDEFDIFLEEEENEKTN